MTIYNSVEKYKDAVELADFMDESKAPKNPHRTILSEHEGIIKEIIKEDREESSNNVNLFYFSDTTSLTTSFRASLSLLSGLDISSAIISRTRSNPPGLDEI
jgi:hypothetical protein